MIEAAIKTLERLEPEMREEERVQSMQLGEKWIESLRGEKEKIETLAKMKLVKNWIQSTRIEIAPVAETKQIGSEQKYDYLKSELGMNIILPKGCIKELRFKVTLKGNNTISEKVVAVDGFPKDIIEEKEIMSGKIKVGMTKAFKFIPIVGNTLPKLLEIEFNPWEFKLGSLRKVNVDFSGGLTFQPEWYFKKDGIKNDLNVVLTIRKSHDIKDVVGEVTAAWNYEESGVTNAFKRLFGAKNLQSQEETIKIL